MKSDTTNQTAPQTEITQKSSWGGSRGGGRPSVGEPHTIKFPAPLWKFCLDQPGGAGAFLRRLAEQAMLEAKKARRPGGQDVT